MTTTKKIKKDFKFVNVSKTKNSINFNFYKAQKESNILEETISTGCEIAFDFSCIDNSQYIPII